jgi:enamine deaminase RidA (YjgF/YER057c/UK114 family)
MVERTAVNPWTWSLAFGFNQGELVEGAGRVLFCAGQTSVDEDGAPQHPGDMAAQAALATDNLEAVLRAAGMTLANVVRLNFYTTDVDDYIAQGAAVVGARLGEAGVAPAGTLLGVARLAFPELLLEIEATAVA